MDAEAAQKATLRATLRVLIEVHQFMFTPEELAERLAGVPFGAALHALDEQGLIERRGELVGASRAAVRATQLAC